MSPGTIRFFAWGGALLGVLGGVLGNYASVKNTKGPRELAFVVRPSQAVRGGADGLGRPSYNSVTLI